MSFRHDAKRDISKYNYLPTHPINTKLLQPQKEKVSEKEKKDIKLDSPKEDVSSNPSEKPIVECINPCLVNPVDDEVLLPKNTKEEPSHENVQVTIIMFYLDILYYNHHVTYKQN